MQIAIDLDGCQEGILDVKWRSLGLVGPQASYFATEDLFRLVIPLVQNRTFVLSHAEIFTQRFQVEFGADRAPETFFPTNEILFNIDVVISQSKDVNSFT